MLDINGSEFLVIALLALILVGPERLPEYVRGLRAAVRRVRGFVKEGQTMLRDELGEDLDLSSLDPRQYDPRRIVRDALFEDDDPTPAAGTAAIAALATGAIGTESIGSRKARRARERREALSAGQGAPFDPEAT